MKIDLRKKHDEIRTENELWISGHRKKFEIRQWKKP